MDDVYAVILGIVQGIAEFLPVSSSGHLVIAEALLLQTTGQSPPRWLQGTTMNVALHFGSLLTIAVIYRRELWALRTDVRLLVWLFIASVPVGFAGLLFKDDLDRLFDSPLAAGCGLLATGGLLLLGRLLQTGQVALNSMSFRTSVVVGLVQAIALVPGISRSGSTIAAGIGCGLNRPDAAKFSFLLALPAIGGATFLELVDLLRGETAVDAASRSLLIGAIVSFFVGLLALRWLIRLLHADRLHWFAWYCFAAGTATIIWQLSAQT